MKKLKYLLLVFMLINLSSCGYNKLVDYEEAIQKSWSEVENSYDKRADAVTKFIVSFKQNENTNKSDVLTLEKSLNAIKDLVIPEDALSPSEIEKFMEKQEELSEILRTVLSKGGLNTERVSAIEKVHNGIRQSRKKFNETVATYNTYKRQFPQNVTAGPMGFDNYEPLKIDEGSRRL